MILDFPKHPINIISNYFTMTKCDAGPYGDFKKGTMKVHIDWYICQGLGNVCVLKASAMFGLMKMSTLVINPFEKDAPLFSFDYINAMGNHTLLLELYDTMEEHGENFIDSLKDLNAVKSSLSQTLANYDLGKHWYDYLKLSPSLAVRTKRANIPQLEQAASNYLELYMKLLTSVKPASSKNLKVAEYVDGLFLHGGPSTDAFKKALGEKSARELFEKIVFNTTSK